jgi:hypothetical protein
VSTEPRVRCAGGATIARRAARGAASLQVREASHVNSRTEASRQRKSQKGPGGAARAPGGNRHIPNPPGLSTAEENGLGDSEFAFPKERKEPLMDAEHVRNAIARFDQVEGVSDRERDQAWARIKRAARQYGVHVGESDWRELFVGGKERKQ